MVEKWELGKTYKLTIEPEEWFKYDDQNEKIYNRYFNKVDNTLYLDPNGLYISRLFEGDVHNIDSTFLLSEEDMSFFEEVQTCEVTQIEDSIPELIWQDIESDYGVARRAKISGGWLVSVEGSGLTFVPDANHEW